MTKRNILEALTYVTVYKIAPVGTRDFYAAGYDGNFFPNASDAWSAIEGLQLDAGYNYDDDDDDTHATEWDVIEMDADTEAQEALNSMYGPRQ